MAAIFQLRRGSGSLSLVDGELYVNKGPDSLQYAVGEREITLAKLDELNTGSLYLKGGISASGDITASNLYVSGNVVLGGTITIGDSTSDSVIFNADLSSSIIPDSGSTYDLGSNSKWYKHLYVNTISASFISGAIAGIGNLEAFSQSVDNRLDRVEASSSLYDNEMSGSNRLYVSPSGSDSNDGSDPSVPFRTIKAAVEYLGSAVFSNTKRYTIFVGSGNYTEQNPIEVPPGVAIVGDNLRTVRLTAANPTKDYFHCHNGNYFYGLRFLNLQNPSFAFSYPCSTANTTISGGSIATISVVHSMTGYTNGNNQDLGIIIEGPNVSGSVATATANVAGGVITQINVVSGGTNYSATEKPHISIPAPLSKRPIIDTSPYIQNCSSITGPFTTDGTLLSLIPGNTNYAPLPYNVNDVRNASNAVIGSGVIDEQGAGGGIRIDGNLVHPSSPLESFVADAFTQVNQGGPGHLIINKGYAQFVSCFTTFCTYGFKTVNGGFANISNSVIDFGKEGLVSKTYFPQTYNTGSSLQTLTSTVVGAVIQQDGAGYTGSVASVTISGGGASVQATAEANVNANGSIDQIVILTPGSGYTSQPTLTIAAPTGGSAIQATTVAGKAEISGIAAILFQLESGSRGIDISSNMILSGSNYLVTNVATGSSANQRYVTVYPAPPSITTGDNVYFHQLSNISTGGLVMEYGGSGVTYNALPKFGGVPNRTKEIVEYAPGRVFYSTVDNIGNLKIGDFFAVNQLTGEVTIDANQFNLSGLSAIGPFKRNGVGVGVILNEVSNNATLLNAQGITGEDTVPTQFAVKGYIDIRDGRLNNLEAFTASISGTNAFTASTKTRLTNLESTSASVNTSITELNSYTASLKQAITASGADITINGNLTVKGTTTQIDSTTLNIGDNIIQLNGSSVANAGLQVKDTTGASGSLLWDSTLDYWKGGVLGNESKILLAGGDNVISSSAQLGDLNAFTASVTSSLVSIYQTTSSLNLFSASVTSSLVSIYQTTASLNTATQSLYSSASLMTASIVSLTSSVVALQDFSGNVNTRFTTLGIYTGSVDTKFTTLGTYTASVNQTTASLNLFSASVTSSLESIYQTTSSLNQFSASVTSSLVSIYQTTSSLNQFSASVTSSLVSIYQTTSSLNSFTTSTSQSLWYLYSSSTNHEERIDYIEGIGGISGGSPLGPLNIFSASINTFTASIAGTNAFTTSTNSRLNSIEAATSSYETNGRSIVSGSSQLASAFEVIASSTHTLLSGSSQILGGTDIHSGSYTGNNGIVSGSSQINADSITNFDSNVKDKLNTDGVVSGSSQLSSAFELIASSTHTLVSGSSQVTLSSTTGGSTSSHVQFHCIGLGTAASGVVGEVRATGDITAFYSSDIRLKENIQPIQNALEKVESISGNTYDWKEGYEEIHSHKGNDVGVIAQEIEEILPQIVTNRDNGYKAVQYEKIIPLLIEAIKELSAKIKRLENK
jgi:ABC-type transporter Mla subunit MlaD